MIEIKNYIDGKLQPPAGGKYLDNFDPSKGEVYSRIPDSGREDVEQAVKAAGKAFHGWASLDLDSRSRYLMRISEGIEARLDQLARAEARDNGKPLKLAARVDIPRASANFRFYAQAATQFPSESHSMAGRAINYTLRQPLGVVGCISPWNLPLYLFSWKIAPALAAGNTVVAKPSEITPMTAYVLSEICIESGLPPGVLNIVHGTGPGAGESIVDHRDVKGISFTGGTKTGARIAARVAPTFRKLSLELGGKNPNIVFSDCDYDKMLRTTMLSSFANQGQICLCGSRVLIEENIYERVKKDIVEKAKQLVVGPPENENTQLGAVVSEAHLEKVLSYIKLAREEGGNVLCGGERVRLEGAHKNGWYIRPTVIDGLEPRCRSNQEEIFGPVITLIPFKDEEQALEYANCTPYGLSSTLWTQDLSRAHRMAEKLEAGIVWINCWLLRDLRTPFGGVKQSGMGREGGFEAMRFFTEPKNVCVEY